MLIHHLKLHCLENFHCLHFYTAHLKQNCIAECNCLHLTFAVLECYAYEALISYASYCELLILESAVLYSLGGWISGTAPETFANLINSLLLTGY